MLLFHVIEKELFCVIEINLGIMEVQLKRFLSQKNREVK